MLNDQTKERIKGIFSEWIDLNDSKKEISSQMNHLITTAADIAEVKPTIMRKTFSFVKSKKEKSIDELDEIVSIFTAIEER